MSFHDRKLVAASARRAKKPKTLFQMMLRGVADITLDPVKPKIKLGSNADDWKAVGDDLRYAMRQIDLCE